MDYKYFIIFFYFSTSENKVILKIPNAVFLKITIGI